MASLNDGSLRAKAYSASAAGPNALLGHPLSSWSALKCNGLSPDTSRAQGDNHPYLCINLGYVVHKGRLVIADERLTRGRHTQEIDTHHRSR